MLARLSVRQSCHVKHHDGSKQSAVALDVQIAHVLGVGLNELLSRRHLVAHEHIEDFVGLAEEYVRENPGQAMLYAFVAGFVLNRLPLGALLRGFLTKFHEKARTVH